MTAESAEEHRRKTGMTTGMKTTRRTRVGVAVATVALLAAVGGCGDDDDNGDGGASPSPTASPTLTQSPTPTESPSPTESPTATAGEAATVMVREAGDLGPILTDGEGRTLYLFEADEDEKSTCNDACAVAWPPLTTSGEPKAGEKADAELLGTTERDDGSTQVTYNGHPLYFFQNDKKPGDTTGQGVEGFGAAWFALTASGDKAEGDAQDTGDPGVTGGY
ncbi:hypothetical protein U9R90_13860 [Streptomyces sp. E11-3]|uniref:COG4315 family predicted lipoprotein n=1 Tax=Streptomyces sp. E11-3 TaxID=3110112 RepID=UPI00397EB799